MILFHSVYLYFYECEVWGMVLGHTPNDSNCNKVDVTASSQLLSLLSILKAF